MIRAMTRTMWMSPPAIFMKKPRSQNTSRITAMVSSIPELRLRGSLCSCGILLKLVRDGSLPPGNAPELPMAADIVR